MRIDITIAGSNVEEILSSLDEMKNRVEEIVEDENLKEDFCLSETNVDLNDEKYQNIDLVELQDLCENVYGFTANYSKK